jgi:hypothetical protein
MREMPQTLENAAVATNPAVQLARESARTVAPNLGRVQKPSGRTAADLANSATRNLAEAKRLLG